MAFDMKSTLEELKTHLNQTGRFSVVQIGEPTKPWVGDGLFGSVSILTNTVQILFLDGGTEELHVVQVRLWRDAFRETPENAELLMAQAAGETMERIAEDFTQRATVRHVDLAGIRGIPMSAEWGYIALGDVTYKIVDITVPITVDDSATAAA